MGALGTLLVVLAASVGQAEGASIAGRVTDRITGQPVPRMVVSALGSDRQRAGEGTTDADGRYEIAGLRPGAYAVNVRHDEHRSTYLPQWFGEDGPSIFGVPRAFAITLKAGDRRADVDVALTRALAIEGLVLDPSGDPVAQVSVQLVGAAGWTDGRPAFTDDRGAYRLYGLVPGRYRVCAQPPRDWNTGADPTGLVRTCHPGAIVQADASDVTLSTQDATGIDIRLQRAGIRSISGTVVGANGAAVDGAFVIARPPDEAADGGNARTRNGAFTVKGLAPGRYFVQAALGSSDRGDANTPAGSRETAYASVDVASADATVALTLSKGVTIAGTITFEGTAPPKRGIPRLGVRTWAGGDFSAWNTMQPVSATVRPDLSFELGEVFPVPLHVYLYGLPDGWALKSVRYGDRDITTTPTDFQSVPAARLEMIVTDKVASPLVKVVNDHGEETPASQVIAIPADSAQWAVPFMRYPTGPSSAAGAKLGTMLPGDYFFAGLSLEDFTVVLKDPSRLPSLATIGTRVTLEPGDTRLRTVRLVPLPGR